MSMSRRRFVLLGAILVGLNAAFWLAQSGFALPRAVIDRFFGPRIVRAEVVLQPPTGAVRDFRLDRGRVLAASAGSLTLRERDGTTVTIQVSPLARVVGTGAPALVSQLQGWRVLVIRQANRPANLVQVEGKP